MPRVQQGTPAPVRCKWINSIIGPCQNCRYSEQCSGSGSYCCPFMKKCIVRGQRCYDPVAECSPRCPALTSPVTECKGCKIVNLKGGWDKWAPPTCGSFEDSSSGGGAPPTPALSPPPPLPFSAERDDQWVTAESSPVRFLRCVKRV